MYRFAIAVLTFWANSAMAQGYLLKPVDATCISSPFGPRTIRNHPEAGTFHFGLDFAAPEGSPVWAIEAGTLMKVQQNGPGGLEGRAIDVRLSGFATRSLAEHARTLGRGGVGFYARSDFVHVDTGRVRFW